MKILVDADACPVKNIIEDVAKNYKIPVLLICNPNHLMKSEYADILVVDGTSQSADIAISNNTKKGDLVLTNDYGLAAMVLGKKAFAMDFYGKEYSLDNIDSLLMQRYVNQKARQSGYKLRGPQKRTLAMDKIFRAKLIILIENIYKNS